MKESRVNVTRGKPREGIREALYQEILGKIDLSEIPDDADFQEMIRESVKSAALREGLSLRTQIQLGKSLFNSFRKLDLLQELIEDRGITEIMVNGPNAIFIEKRGRLERFDQVFASSQKLEDVIQQIAAGSNRMVNEFSPIVDARLEDGSRVNVVLPPVAVNGPILTIRKFPENPMMMTDLISLGAISEEAAEFLKSLVKARYNFFISGGTGAGKTTFLNALSGYIPDGERIITIEDNAELRLDSISNLVSLEARNRNTEGMGEITIRDLIRTSLRMRPDRIIVGEVRSAEAIDMLQAMNTGHDGSLSTGHANSPEDMLSRLEMMVLMGMDLPISAIRRQIASGIDILIHLGRLRDKSRKVLEIVEIVGFQDDKIRLNPLYRYKNGELRKVGTLREIQKLEAAGLSDLCQP